MHVALLLSQWLYLAVCCCTWLYLALPGCTWLFLGVPGCTWLFMYRWNGLDVKGYLNAGLLDSPQQS